jgi:ribitol-5-phosphate 2-dehydrogenase
LDSNFEIDHAFECAGGEGSAFAIDDAIKYINPQGTIMIMGVSENKVPVFTRNVLEKGLTIVGSSRSGREDFEKTVNYLETTNLAERLKKIIYIDEEVTAIKDINRVFANDANTTFKTVFKWNV